MNKCLECNNEMENSKFCDNVCAAKYNNKNRTINKSFYKEVKEVKCILCEKNILINKVASPKKAKCNKCKQIKICKSCGQNKCIHPKICKKYRLFPSLIKYFGFDGSTIGTIKIYNEYNRIKTILYEKYYSDSLCLSDVGEQFGHYVPSNLAKIFNSMNIKLRNFSESSQISLLNNKRYLPSCGIIWKTSWHTTWDNRDVFCRSSYELDYCKLLDAEKIHYEMEKIRILYWDSQKQKQRVAIPDFYILEDNLIVEIKSSYTYDEQNMRDKVKSYKEHGYDFKLILDKKEAMIDY